MQSFRPREDGQIMGLELLSIALGDLFLLTFCLARLVGAASIASARHFFLRAALGRTQCSDLVRQCRGRGRNAQGQACSALHPSV